MVSYGTLEEDHQIFSHHRKVAAKKHRLGLTGTYIMGISGDVEQGGGGIISQLVKGFHAI